ncbi:MAG: UxaA family hydrolase, partial [Candidatus Rokuibacteriota bacterium]
MPLTQYVDAPRYLRQHEADNVAVIVNDGGVSAGTVFGDGLRAQEAIPQCHKVALRPIAEGEAVRRYGQVIG